MINVFKDYLREYVRGIKFPIQKSENGYYPVILSDEGNIRCPNCGCSSSWSIKNYSKITCNTCHSEYHNLGVLGLAKLTD